MKAIGIKYEGGRNAHLEELQKCTTCSGNPAETYEKIFGTKKCKLCSLCCNVVSQEEYVTPVVKKDKKQKEPTKPTIITPAQAIIKPAEIKAFELDSYYNTDTFASIKNFENDVLDLISEDIPYGEDYKSNWRMTKEQGGTCLNSMKIANDDNLDWLPEHLDECHRILKPNRHIYIFCGKYVDVVKPLMEQRFDKVKILVWDKGRSTGMGDLKADYQQNTEFIIFAQKGRRIRQSGERPSNILRYPINKADLKEHPTPKPEPLIADLIKYSTQPNETVFDGFAGRGVTGIASYKLGRRFILFEYEKTYYNIIDKNIKLTKAGYSSVSKMQKTQNPIYIQSSLF